MFMHKRILLSGCFLLLAALVFTFSPVRAKVAAAASCPPTQNTGSSGPWVQVLQFRLNAAYYYNAIFFPNYPLATDGSFGSNTATAAHNYQTGVMGIAAGAVAASTWSSLGFCDGFNGIGYILSGDTGAGNHCPGGLGVGSSGIWVQALQWALNVDAEHSAIPITYGNDNVWYPLTIDGSFGALTQTAVKALQYSNTISIDGSVGNQTWGVMGLCY